MPFSGRHERGFHAVAKLSGGCLDGFGKAERATPLALRDHRRSGEGFSSQAFTPFAKGEYFHRTWRRNTA
jgi:hypothetical protein